MSNHTPGPWLVDDAKRVMTDWTKVGFLTTIADCNLGGGSGDEKRANARLISAAPDLLEAIEMVTSKLPVIMDPDADYSETCSEIEITWREWSVFRSAINKATGEA